MNHLVPMWLESVACWRRALWPSNPACCMLHSLLRNYSLASSSKPWTVCSISQHHLHLRSTRTWTELRCLSPPMPTTAVCYNSLHNSWVEFTALRWPASMPFSHQSFLISLWTWFTWLVYQHLGILWLHLGLRREMVILKRRTWGGSCTLRSLKLGKRSFIGFSYPISPLPSRNLRHLLSSTFSF